MDAETRFHQNTKLAYHVVHKYYYKTPPQDLEDVFQVALIGLWKACLSYDESRGIKFSSYAGRCVYNEVGMYLRHMRNNPVFVSYEGVLEGTERLTPEDILTEADDEYSLWETLEMFSGLDEQEKEIIRLRLEGIGQVEIGKRLGCSQSWISRKMTSIKNKVAGWYV